MVLVKSEDICSSTLIYEKAHNHTLKYALSETCIVTLTGK